MLRFVAHRRCAKQFGWILNTPLLMYRVGNKVRHLCRSLCPLLRLPGCVVMYDHQASTNPRGRVAEKGAALPGGGVDICPTSANTPKYYTLPSLCARVPFAAVHAGYDAGEKCWHPVRRGAAVQMLPAEKLRRQYIRVGLIIILVFYIRLTCIYILALYN